MNRRQALHKTSWILKSTLFAPSLLSAIQACRPQVESDNDLQVLDVAQNKLVTAIADTIIPRTDTPGASDVKVHRFLDVLLKDVFEEEVKEKFLSGLSEFNQECQSATGSDFIDLSAGDRGTYLTPLDREVMGQSYEKEVPFYYTFKHLMTTIYFSSEQGAKQNLNYRPVPGPYEGDIAYHPGDKITIGNHM
ncbi:MAG: gluconate 2-dehydrogenase subunit 3 family protein [Cyclobacteriaceae bacterium]|nr:gluconate 2-dehydrogenase subunit 3 family protein [Cyclobacteriaceae bacterium]